MKTLNTTSNYAGCIGYDESLFTVNYVSDHTFICTNISTSEKKTIDSQPLFESISEYVNRPNVKMGTPS